MQTAINTDVFVMSVMETLMGQMEMWAEQERDRLDKVQAALYMNLMNKTIIVDDGPQRQLPAEYVDDTPRVIEMFLRCKQLEKRTENTLENYRGELKCLFRYVNKNYADVKTNDIRSYLYWKQTVKNNKDTTLNNKIHVFQSFYSWVMDEELIEEGGCLSRKPRVNPMAKIHRIKEEKKVRRVLTDEQVEMIRCDCTHVRDKAIVEIFTATGMRVSELVRMNKDDLDFRNNRCIVYGKGRKERPAFFTGRAIVHLQEYLEWRMSLGDDNPALFVNLRKTKGKYTRMLTDSVRNMLKAIVASDPRLAKLNLHPHMFRAYLATYMSRHGAPLKDIKAVLGHANINTTLECYVIEGVEDIQAAHEKYAA